MECVDQLIKDIVQETAKEEKKLMRKHSINRDNWQKNKKKRAYQSGKTYVNSRGKQVEPED